MDYGKIAERNFDLAKTLIHQMVPERDLLEFSKFFINMSDEYSEDEYNTEYLDSYRVGFLYNCAVVFTNFKKWKNTPTLTYPKMSIMVNLLNYRDSMEIFQRLPENIQKHLLVIKSENTKEAVNAYLRCIDRIGIRTLEYVGNRSLIRTSRTVEYGQAGAVRKHTMECAKDILQNVLEASIRLNRTQTIDCSPIKPHFRTKIFDSGIALNSLGDVRVPVIIMWKALYGEGNVLDCINRFESSNCFFSPDQVMDILEEWDELKNYPMEWISETRHYAAVHY